MSQEEYERRRDGNPSAVAADRLLKEFAAERGLSIAYGESAMKLQVGRRPAVFVEPRHAGGRGFFRMQFKQSGIDENPAKPIRQELARFPTSDPWKSHFASISLEVLVSQWDAFRDKVLVPYIEELGRSGSPTPKRRLPARRKPAPQAAWVIRAWTPNDFEDFVQRGFVALQPNRFDTVGDATATADLEDLYATADPAAGPGRVASQAALLNTFINEINDGDLLVISQHRHMPAALGSVEGKYEFAVGYAAHRRAVAIDGRIAALPGGFLGVVSVRSDETRCALISSRQLPLGRSGIPHA